MAVYAQRLICGEYGTFKEGAKLKGRIPTATLQSWAASGTISDHPPEKNPAKAAAKKEKIRERLIPDVEDFTPSSLRSQFEGVRNADAGTDIDTDADVDAELAAMQAGFDGDPEDFDEERRVEDTRIIDEEEMTHDESMPDTKTDSTPARIPTKASRPVKRTPRPR